MLSTMLSLAYPAGRDRLLKVVGALRPSSLKANAVNDRHSGPLLPYTDTDTETGSWTRRGARCSSHRRSRSRSRCSSSAAEAHNNRSRLHSRSKYKKKTKTVSTVVAGYNLKGGGVATRCGTCVNAKRAECKAIFDWFWLTRRTQHAPGHPAGGKYFKKLTKKTKIKKERRR